jgi:hypothetical protein
MYKNRSFASGECIMGKLVFVDDDFKRMLRSDILRIQRLAEAGKFGKHTVPYKDKMIKIEIAKKGDTISVKKVRVN